MANVEKKEGDKKTASITIVLRVDMHCQGCATKILNCALSFKGVETVKSDFETGKLTVTGQVDPAKLRETLAEKTKKKVELISTEEKEVPLTTAMLKLNFHCKGCIAKIQKTVAKTKGVHGLTMDKEKQLVTVEGTLDVKKLIECLSTKLKRPVEIAPLEEAETSGVKDNGKDKEAGGSGGKDKEAGDSGGKDKEAGDSGGKDKEAGDSGGKDKESGGGVNMMKYVAAQPYYESAYYPGGYPVQAHAPQMFSDENPNACVVS